MSRDENTPPEEKKNRRGRKRLGALLLLIISLIWLNGPGWRWLGGIGLRRALEKADLEGDFKLEGTLIGGIRVEELSLRGGIIRKLEIGSASPVYEITRVLRGEIEGIIVERIDLVLDLAAATPKDPDEPDKPFNPDELPETLRKIRTWLLPIDLNAADLRFQLVRGADSIVTLDTSEFSHLPGSDEFRLNLGTIVIEPGYAFDPQETLIRWTDESLALDRFDVTPRFGVSEVRVDFPLKGGLALAGMIRVEDSRLLVDSTLSSASLRLEGEPLSIQEAAKNFAISVPAEATVRRLEATIDGFDKSPDQWQIAARAETTGVRYADWQAETLVVDASKTDGTGKLTWTVAALEGKLEGQADFRWRDLAAGAWMDFDATAQASIPQVAPLFAALKSKLAFAPPEAPPLPASSFKIDATINSAADGIRSAEGTWLLSAEKDVASLAGETRWSPDGKLSGTLGTDGLRSTYSLDLKAKRYEANADLESFRPERLSQWADAAGVGLPTGVNVSGTWQGSGDFAPQPHRGTFDIPSFEWVRKDAPPLVVRTMGDYVWPQEVTLSDLTAISDGQTIHAEARLVDKILKIPRIEWRDGENRLVGGQAEIPVPEQPTDVKAFLRQEIPLNVFLESEWIDHSRLAAWLPEKKSPLAEGSGRVRLVITGTPAKPKINLETSVKGLRLRDQPDVPVTDATATLDAGEDGLVLAGEIKPAGYDPITLSGKMPFRPGEWAEKPEIMLEEKLEARANIPRLELATFKRFIPTAEQFAGTVEGFFTATGTVGKPDLGGELRLTGGAISLKDSQDRPVSNVAALIRLKGRELLLESLSLDCAGGTLTGRGTVGLADATKPTFDFSIVGNSLPLKRDESMIVRADANLSLRGDLQQAGISGTIEIVDSLYFRDFEILPVRLPFTAPSRPKLAAIDPDEKAADFPAPFAGWTLDVVARTRDPMLIRGNLAKGSATADVRFGGTLGNIQPQGSAVFTEVEAKLPFSTLKVNGGTATFTPAGGLNPELNIRGTSNIGRYEVNVFFYGPVNAPKTALTSDPPLPESEIMTLLATGTTSDGLEDGQAATMKAAQLLVEEWRRGRLPFAEQVGKALEVMNRVDVRIGEDDPLTGKRLNSATIEVTERVFVSGSVDKQSNTRVLGAFVLRFK